MQGSPRQLGGAGACAGGAGTAAWPPRSTGGDGAHTGGAAAGVQPAPGGGGNTYLQFLSADYAKRRTL